MKKDLTSINYKIVLNNSSASRSEYCSKQQPHLNWQMKSTISKIKICNIYILSQQDLILNYNFNDETSSTSVNSLQDRNWNKISMNTLDLFTANHSNSCSHLSFSSVYFIVLSAVDCVTLQDIILARPFKQATCTKYTTALSS